MFLSNEVFGLSCLLSGLVLSCHVLKGFEDVVNGHVVGLVPRFWCRPTTLVLCLPRLPFSSAFNNFTDMILFMETWPCDTILVFYIPWFVLSNSSSVVKVKYHHSTSLLICVGVFRLQVVQEYERAVIFRLGRLNADGAKGPGIVISTQYVNTYDLCCLFRSRTFILK